MSAGDFPKVPAAAIICCSDPIHEDIIKNIIGISNLPSSTQIADDVTAYPWFIETKYYTASIHLLSLKSKNLVSSDFANNIEAVLIHFDNEKVDSLKTVESWFPFLEHFSPQVSILACNNCQNENAPGLKREEIIKWCLENNFELVELNPDIIDDDEIEDDFQETKGYKRIIQAFHANLWGNLVMKDTPSLPKSTDITQNLENMSNILAGVSATEEKQSTSRVLNEKIDTLFDEDKWLFDAVGEEDPGGTSFESLFSRILNLKEKAATLDGEERKLYAEKVAVEFWRALGGDEEEIAGLSDAEE